MKVGVIDSGIGGIKVLEGLQKVYKGEYVYLFDKSFMPYGDKTFEQINDRIHYCCDFLISKNVDMIVLACNTASCCALEKCKNDYKIPVLGLIPPIKSFILGNDKVLFLSTLLTSKLLEDKFKNLDCNNNVIFAPQKKLAWNIENYFNDKELIGKYLLKHINIYKNKCNKVFLGCTHYYYLKKDIEKLLKVEVFDGREQLEKEFMEMVDNLILSKSKTTFYYL